MVVVGAAVVFGVVALVRATTNHATTPPREPADSARAILRERLARGEISPKEYSARAEVFARPDRRGDGRAMMRLGG